jgi:2-hydroxychromene-2-carboxylate isomerase
VNRGPRVHFSLRSPFSWIAIEHLLRVVPDAHDVVEFIPYWDPDARTEAALSARGASFHYVAMSKAKHMYILHDTKRLTQRLGLRMAWPIDVDPWWELPHLAWLRARREGKAAEFYDALVTARWRQGDNICDRTVLETLAASAGLDGRAVAGACHDDDIRAEATECLVRAYEDDIFGIPYFRIGRHRFWGYDRLPLFLDELLAALGRAPATTVSISPEPASPEPVPAYARSAVGAFDTDTAGGCG